MNFSLLHALMVIIIVTAAITALDCFFFRGKYAVGLVCYYAHPSNNDKRMMSRHLQFAQVVPATLHNFRNFA